MHACVRVEGRSFAGSLSAESRSEHGKGRRLRLVRSEVSVNVRSYRHARFSAAVVLDGAGELAVT